MLGINPNEKNERLKKRAEKAGCEWLLEGYHTGKSSRVDGVSKEELQAIANKCNTYTEIGEKLGYVGRSSQCEMGRKIAEKYSLSFQHNISQTKMSEFVSEHSTDYLQKIVKNSHTFTDVAKYFNVSVPFIKKVMIALSIDYTHFDRYYYHTNKNIFTNGNRVPAKQLLAGLNSMGRTRCESCGNNGTWNGYPIPLEVHHINGIHEDNRIENLMIVCPNCHASIEERGTDIEKRKPKTQVIIQEANCKCERCKEEKWMNRNIPLEIHHTSGDHFDCSSPLEVLCPNCHAVETLLQNKQRKPKNITDNMLVQALSNSPSIHQGILSIGLSPTGSTYKRARRLVEQHHIKHLMPLTSSLVEEIESYLLSLPVIKEELVKDICKTYGINKKDMSFTMAIKTKINIAMNKSFPY